jgi:hypothetical protein
MQSGEQPLPEHAAREKSIRAESAKIGPTKKKSKFAKCAQPRASWQSKKKMKIF